MSLFKKAEVPTEQPNVEDLNAQITDLKGQVAELQAFKDNQIKLDHLSAKASELGFTGNVATILNDAKGDLTSAFGGMITAFRAEVTERKEEFVETAPEEDAGDSTPNEDVDVKPQTRSAAIAIVKSNYNLTGSAAVAKARDLYPTVMSGVAPSA